MDKYTMTVAERNRNIKKALKEVYGNTVSLHGHRGTAYGWIDIKIVLPVPAGHAHIYNQYGRCKECYELSSKEEQNVRRIAHETVNKIGSYIGTYSSDDGYNTERDNMLVNIEYI